MFKLGGIALAVVLAACGAGSKSSQQTMPMAQQPSECEVMAKHVAGVVMRFQEPPPTTEDAVADVIGRHCESDGWSADAKQCLGGATDEPSVKACVSSLTEQQHDAVMTDFRALVGVHKDEAKTTDASPPPPPQPEPNTGGSIPGGGDGGDGADPCEGGE